jgi:hypothetical protein
MFHCLKNFIQDNVFETMLRFRETFLSIYLETLAKYDTTYLLKFT